MNAVSYVAVPSSIASGFNVPVSLGLFMSYDTLNVSAVHVALIVTLPPCTEVKFLNVALAHVPVYPVRDIDTRSATVYSSASYVATNVAVCLSVDTVTLSLTDVIVPAPALNVTVYVFAVHTA